MTDVGNLLGGTAALLALGMSALLVPLAVLLVARGIKVRRRGHPRSGAGIALAGVVVLAGAGVGMFLTFG